MTDYYDIVLGLIPLTVAGVAGLLFVFGVDPSLSVATGSVLSVPLLAHALFVRAPVAATPETEPTAGAEQTRGPVAAD